MSNLLVLGILFGIMLELIYFSCNVPLHLQIRIYTHGSVYDCIKSHDYKLGHATVCSYLVSCIIKVPRLTPGCFLCLWGTRKASVKQIHLNLTKRGEHWRQKRTFLVLDSNPSMCFFLTLLTSPDFQEAWQLFCFHKKQSDLHETAVLIYCVIFPKDWPFDDLLQN